MEKIVKSIPVISGVLLFLGYLNYTFYYNFFGIEITSYLTTGELLLSFLQLTIPVIIVCAILFILFLSPVINILFFPQKDVEEEEHSNIFINELFKEYLNEVKVRKFKKLSDYMYLFVGVILLISTIIKHIFIIVFPIFIYNQIRSSKPYLLNISLTIGLGVLWFLFFWGVLDVLQKRRNEDYSRIIIVLMIVFVVASIYIANKSKATSVLSGDHNINVKAYFANDTVATDSNHVYIGQTDKYLFFRNLGDNSNEIYNMSNVIKFEMQK